jgi:hypothetical protein
MNARVSCDGSLAARIGSMFLVIQSCAWTRPDGAAQLKDGSAGGAPASSRAQLLRAGAASRGAAQIVQNLVDEVGPRLAGSPGGAAAIQWAIRTLRERGFSNVHPEPVTVPHWERGEESAAVVWPVAQPLQLTALGGSIATPPGGIEAEVVLLDSLEALDGMSKGSVSGKIVFFDVPMARARDGSGYGKAVRVRTQGSLQAAAAGAAAVLIRSIGTDHNRLPHTGAMRRDEQAPTVPAAALSVPDAELLHRLVAEHKTVKVRLRLGCRWLPDAQSANVVGDIPGSASPEQIVLLAAHLDSWDLGTGAIDDGAGVGIVVHAAQLIASLPEPPKRTIRVVLFANEENGLSGAHAYAQAHREEAASHVAALEADSGTARAYALRYLGAPEGRPKLALIAGDLKPLGIELNTDDAHGGADLGPLRALGVPMIDIAQDVSTYFDFHHTANDTWDRVDPEALAAVAAAFAVVADGVANLAGDLGRVPEEKRQAARSGPLRMSF